jgi:enterochelin esterase-like enzyme
VADVQMSLGVLPPFIIVMPGADMRAGEASKYSWTNRGRGSYEDFVVNELIPYIDQYYSTWASRDGRAIGGISRGGYWAIEIAFAHPDLFSAVGGHSPSVFTQLVGVPPNFSMLSTARSIDELHNLRIWLDAGDADWAKVDMQKLIGDLDDAGVPYYAEVGEGGHEDSYWTSRVPDYLAFYSAAWPRAARAKQAPSAAANP